MTWKCEYCGLENPDAGCCIHCGAPNPLDAYITKTLKPDVFMDSVRSSFIDSIGYDESGKRLIVRLKSGSIYEYLGVPRDLVLDLIGTDSKGRFYANHIRGKFESKRL